MRWLKTLVIGMGVAIVIGLTVVVVEVAQRAGEPSRPPTQGTPLPTPPVIGTAPPVLTAGPAKAIGDISIDIPPGAVVVETVTGPSRLVVRLRLPDGSVALLLIDPATGGKLGLITLDNRTRSP